MTKRQSEYRAWRQTPQAEVVMDAYRRLAKEGTDRGCTFDMTRLALGGVQGCSPGLLSWIWGRRSTRCMTSSWS